MDSLCRSYTEESVRILAAVARDVNQPGATRVTAAVSLLDRGHGKPKQVTKIEGGGADGQIIVELVNFSAKDVSK